MARRVAVGVIAAVLCLGLASAARAQDPTPTPSPTPTATPTATPAPAPAAPVLPPPLNDCTVTSAGLLCPQLPAGCVVTSAGLLCPPADGEVGGESADNDPEPPRNPRRRPRGDVAPDTADHVPAAVAVRRLAFTGWDGAPIAALGAGLLLAGVALRRRAGT